MMRNRVLDNILQEEKVVLILPLTLNKPGTPAQENDIKVPLLRNCLSQG
jgi:hypothetical protein